MDAVSAKVKNAEDVQETQQQQCVVGTILLLQMKHIIGRLKI